MGLTPNPAIGALYHYRVQWESSATGVVLCVVCWIAQAQPMCRTMCHVGCGEQGVPTFFSESSAGGQLRFAPGGGAPFNHARGAPPWS